MTAKERYEAAKAARKARNEARQPFTPEPVSPEEAMALIERAVEALESIALSLLPRAHP